MIARLAPVAATLAAVSLGFPEQAENVPPPQHAAFSQHAAPCVDTTCSPTRPSSTTQSCSNGPEDVGRQRPNTSASAASRSRSSLALRRPTDSPSLSGLTAVVCSTSTRVDEPWSSIVGRNDRGGAAVDVGDTSTVESASSSSAWTMTA